MTFLQNLCLILHKIEKSSSPWSKILFVKFLQRLFWWVINESSEDLKLKYIFQDVTFNIQSNGDLNKSWCLMENTHLNKMKIIIYISELLNLYQYKSAFHICYFHVSFVRIAQLSSESLSHLAFCNTWAGYC